MPRSKVSVAKRPDLSKDSSWFAGRVKCWAEFLWEFWQPGILA